MSQWLEAFQSCKAPSLGKVPLWPRETVPSTTTGSTCSSHQEPGVTQWLPLWPDKVTTLLLPRPLSRQMCMKETHLQCCFVQNLHFLNELL